jgi:hypothetical protein
MEAEWAMWSRGKRDKAQAGNGRWLGGDGEASMAGGAPQREVQVGNGSCRVEVTAVHSSIEGSGIGREWEVAGWR